MTGDLPELKAWIEVLITEIGLLAGLEGFAEGSATDLAEDLVLENLVGIDELANILTH